jgi:tight adherence protein B
MKDYHKYRLNIKEVIQCIGISVILTTAISWVFYRDTLGLLLLLVLLPATIVLKKKTNVRQQQQQLAYEFKEALRLLASALQAGYAPENALIGIEVDLARLMGQEAVIVKELQYINRQIKLNVPIEKLFKELAYRSHVEEINGFSQVFAYAKRGGGDFVKIIKDTTDRIEDKVEVEREIQVVMAAKKLEQNIMNAIPLGILLFVDISSPGFLTVMYEDIFGRVVMSLCLLVYGGAYLISRKIVNIKI